MKKKTGGRQLKAKGVRRGGSVTSSLAESRRRSSSVPFPSIEQVAEEERQDVAARLGDGLTVGGLNPELPSPVVTPAAHMWDIGEDVVIDQRPLADPFARRPGPTWHCPYGCPGVLWPWDDDDRGEAHTWDCPYWQREGKNETPFDLPSERARKET